MRAIEWFVLLSSLSALPLSYAGIAFTRACIKHTGRRGATPTP